jgi:hypothetical protein
MSRAVADAYYLSREALGFPMVQTMVQTVQPTQRSA